MKGWNKLVIESLNCKELLDKYRFCRNKHDKHHACNGYKWLHEKCICYERCLLRE